MPNLNSLPTELVTAIGSYLGPNGTCLLRLINKELHEKTSHDFSLYFKTVRVSLIRISIQRLSDVAWGHLGDAIKRLIIGSETLDQYPLTSTPTPNAFRQLLANEPKTSDMRRWLQNIIVNILKKVHTITIEDRPEDPTSAVYRRSMGHAEITRKTGVGLRWNGPYIRHVPYYSYIETVSDHPYIRHASGHQPDRTFPLVSRSLVFTTVFNILRYLHTRDRVLNLRIIMRGHRVIENHPSNRMLNLLIMMRGHRVIENHPSDIAKAFDITEDVVLEVVRSHVTHIELGEDDSTYLITPRVIEFVQEIRDVALSRGISLVVRSADGRLAELAND